MDMMIDRRGVLGAVFAAGALVAVPEIPAARAKPRDRTAELQDLIDRTPAGGEALVPEGLWEVSQLRLAREGMRLRGASSGTVLRALDPGRDLLVIGAPDVSLADLRLEGVCRRPYPEVFAVRTTGRATARPKLTRVTFAGASSGAGFTNGVKLDGGADDALVEDCSFAQLWGVESGTGYGVLCTASGARILGNSGTGQPGRGRHFVYLSAGASQCRVERNSCSGFEFEALTTYAREHQPSCVGNQFLGNHVRRSARAARLDVGSISLFANVRDTLIRGNLVEDSGGCGIVLNGANSARFRNNRVEANEVLRSALIGIDVIALDGGSVAGNTVVESSQAAPGTHSNIRIVSDGQRPSRDVVVERNRSSGSRYARSAFQINPTRPMAERITVRNNEFGRGIQADVELNGARTLR